MQSQLVSRAGNEHCIVLWRFSIRQNTTVAAERHCWLAHTGLKLTLFHPLVGVCVCVSKHTRKLNSKDNTVVRISINKNWKEKKTTLHVDTTYNPSMPQQLTQYSYDLKKGHVYSSGYKTG